MPEPHPLLMEAARQFLNDLIYSVTERVKRWRAFLREVSVQKERQLMAQFRALNGFDPTDDVAKRRTIDEVALQMTGRRPLSDTARNALTITAHPMRQMMRIGWRPIHTDTSTDPLSEPALSSDDPSDPVAPVPVHGTPAPLHAPRDPQGPPAPAPQQTAPAAAVPPPIPQSIDERQPSVPSVSPVSHDPVGGLDGLSRRQRRKWRAEFVPPAHAAGSQAPVVAPPSAKTPPPELKSLKRRSAFK
jgi:hypothetical protein